MITLLLALALLAPAPRLGLVAAADERGASLWWTPPAEQAAVTLQRIGAPHARDALLTTARTSDGHLTVTWGPDYDTRPFGGRLRLIVYDAAGVIIAAEDVTPRARRTLWLPWAQQRPSGEAGAWGGVWGGLVPNAATPRPVGIVPVRGVSTLSAVWSLLFYDHRRSSLRCIGNGLLQRGPHRAVV